MHTPSSLLVIACLRLLVELEAEVELWGHLLFLRVFMSLVLALPCFRPSSIPLPLQSSSLILDAMFLLITVTRLVLCCTLLQSPFSLRLLSFLTEQALLLDILHHLGQVVVTSLFMDLPSSSLDQAISSK